MEVITITLRVVNIENKGIVFEDSRRVTETKEIINKDIWITEVGRPSGPSFENYSQQDQASFLETNFNMLKKLRIPIFWYQLIDETYAFPPKETHFGLFDSQNNPKLAVEAFIKFST